MIDMHWPWVRRKTHEKKMRAARVERDRALARLGHTKREELRKVEKMITDLRMVAVQVHGDPNRERVHLTLDIDHHLVWHTFRRDGAFREVVAMMLEREFERSDAGRQLMMRKYP